MLVDCACRPNFTNAPLLDPFAVPPPGALQIEQSEESDQGKYECVATNNDGTRYSAPANLYVRGRKLPPAAFARWSNALNTLCCHSPTNPFLSAHKYVSDSPASNRTCDLFSRSLPLMIWSRTPTTCLLCLSPNYVGKSGPACSSFLPWPSPLLSDQYGRHF